MQTPKNMNVQAEQSVAGNTGSTLAPSTTATAAAAQAPQQITSFFGPAHTSSTGEAPAGTPTPAAVHLTAALSLGRTQKARHAAAANFL